MTSTFPNVVVANLHKRFTGISATVRALLPKQRRELDIGLVDTGKLGLGGTIKLARIAVEGFAKPADAEFRVWHARRDIDMIVGILLRNLLRQKWRLVFTSAARKRPGKTLNFLINRMDAVIATSQRSAGFLDWHSVVIPHGVDTDFFCPAPCGKAKTAAEEKAERIVATVGRVRHSKGTDLFVNAMIKLLPKHPALKAVVIGDCRPEHESFRDQLKKNIEAAGLQDRIEFVGGVGPEEMRNWYRRMALCVAPSRSEGFGLTPLEAFACGTPAVAASTGAWQWVVTDETGAIFKVGELDDLASNLDRLLECPEELARMGSKARDHVVRNHSIANEAKAINALYKRLLSGEVVPKIT